MDTARNEIPFGKKGQIKSLLRLKIRDLLPISLQRQIPNYLDRPKLKRRINIGGVLRRLDCLISVVVPAPCAAFFQGVSRHVPGTHWVIGSPSKTSLAVGVVILVTLALWKIRDRAHVRRERELRQAVLKRTSELERGRVLEGNRNRVLEMLVSNEPLGIVLDAVARLVHDQVPEALCIILLKSNQQQCAIVKENRKQASEFSIGAAPGVPEEWVAAIGHPRSVPFEVWKQHCEFQDPQREPAWRVFVTRLTGSASSRTVPAGPIPAMIRSAPIGDSGGSLGAILMVYPEPGGTEPWNQILRASARLAQIAIEHRRFCDDLDFQAHHDSLTGLPNRILLEQRLEGAIVQSRSRGHRLALLYVDVDAFKQINDRFSHRVGDEFLAEIGRRMKGALRPGDTVARIGGDEFNALLPDVGDSAAATALAHRMLEAVRQPVSVDGHELLATASVGVAMFPDDAEDAVDLGRQADAAMYYAKSLGKNRIQTFADKGDVLDDVRMEQDLRHALQEGWLTVYYQPKFAADGQLAGMEALLRMNHPRHGQILPGQFIPIAEKTELIIPIGAWVIMEVCRQIADWRRRELAPVVVAVNVSAVQVARPDFARSVENCLAAHSVPPCLLELEVTESMVIDRESEAYRQMQLLRNQGVFISIDDFGTGFSSLSYLHRLQIDAVKLDRSFVQQIDTDEAAQRLVRAMIGVAQGLGLDVIAEGVETEEQRLQLVAVGCPVMQGFLFARPSPPEALEDLLAVTSPAADLTRLYGSLEATAIPVAEATSA